MKNRLRVLRAERGWSQAELGGRIGVSRQAVNAIETGKHDPSLPLAFRLARLFGIEHRGDFRGWRERGEAGVSEAGRTSGESARTRPPQPQGVDHRRLIVRGSA